MRDASGAADGTRGLSLDRGAGAPRETLYRWLSKLQAPGVLWQIVVVALLLSCPAVLTGFVAEDYILQYELHGPRDNEWPGKPPWDLYRLLDPAHVARLRDGNGLPWWFYEHARSGFMRPVSGLTHLLDDHLAPMSALFQRLHSMLWLGLLLLSVLWTYHCVIELGWVAAVGSAMFALDSGHAVTLSWIANRSSFIGAVFGVLALGLHHRYRRGDGALFGGLATGSFLLGMFAGELTLGIVGYFVAYGVFMERGSWSSRLLSLWQYAAALLVWLGAWLTGGYGTEGWNAYVDPLREPFTFAKLLPSRFALLWASQTSRLSSDMHELLPGGQRPWFLLAAVGCGAVALYFVWPALRGRAQARFWATGAALAIVPMCAAQPSDRLLTLVGVGVMPLLAYALHDSLARESPPGSSSALRVALAGCYGFVQLGVSALMLPLWALGAATVASVMDRVEASLPSHAGVVDQTVIVASVPDSLLTTFLPVMRSLNGTPRPRRLHWLAATREPVKVERTGEASLRVTPAHGFFDQPQEARARQHPLAAGDELELSDMHIEVVELNGEGRPASVDFVFAEPLETAEYVWLTWRDGQFEPWVPPQVGEAAALPGASDLF